MTYLETVKVLSAKIEFFEQKFRKPLLLSSGPISTITEARATVTVTVGDRQQTGMGSIYLSDLWAWPDPNFSHEQRDAVLRTLCQEVANNIERLCGAAAHPLELGMRLHQWVDLDTAKVPALARGLCVAPFDAAIHDAAGYALGKSAFAFYDQPVPIPSADHYFSGGACAAIREMLRTPPASLEGCWLVNATDDLDGELAEVVKKHGFTNVKVKLLGKNVREDASRTSAVYQALRRHGVAKPRLSGDSNEAHESADAVLEYLENLAAIDSDAFAALTYLEQPTSREIKKHPFDWRKVARRKPVMLDEGLTSLDLLPLAIEQGWSGLALKTCKGHSFVLVAAAWAHQHGLQLTMQDLTNPGYAAIHSYLMAAHLPVINGIELNSPQFTPQANEAWIPRLAGLFDVEGGVHTFNENVNGLGSMS